MLVRPTRASFLTAALAAVCGAAACSSVGSSHSGSSSLSSCPASFDAVANANSCVEGQSCTYLVPCPTFASNATCVCTGGSFVCTGFGDASTRCPVLSTTQSCPTTEKSASGLFCSDLGLICTYPSPCPGIPTFDSCQCIGARSAGEQNHFECSSSCTPLGDATAPSGDGSTADAAGTLDAEDEVRSGSSGDSATPQDARVDP